MGEIAIFLAEQGFRVVSFDLPGHGRSDGKRCDIPAVYAAINALEQQYGPFYAAVSHSFGGLCLMYALNKGLKINHAITISSPFDLTSLLDSYAETLHLSVKVIAVQRKLIEQCFGEDVWQQFSMVAKAAERTVPGLVIHDYNDRHVEINSAEQIAKYWPNSEVMLTKNLGHHRILREPAVMQTILGFVVKE
ncbi:MAG: alpha/beta hydrolase [Candidatus Polarisedimenticolaceae bacterium]|nr:alpha/beta hydrolase [Candidatus Polarisedimenticolaceae bacterium]